MSGYSKLDNDLIFLGSLVRLAVEAFDVEYACNCQYDWVSVYNSQGALLQTWYGSHGKGQETLSPDNMTIWFHTDSSITQTGWIFELSIVDALCKYYCIRN